MHKQTSVSMMMPPPTQILSQIRDLVIQYGRVPDLQSLGNDADLYDAGLSSLASVNLMLALEEAFDVEFPEHMLNRRTFRSISAIHAAIAALCAEATDDQSDA